MLIWFGVIVVFKCWVCDFGCVCGYVKLVCGWRGVLVRLLV